MNIAVHGNRTLGELPVVSQSPRKRSALLLLSSTLHLLLLKWLSHPISVLPPLPWQERDGQGWHEVAKEFKDNKF